MQLIDFPDRERHWYELFARSADTPYRTILVSAERVADELERRITEDIPGDYTDVDHALASYGEAVEIVETRQGTALSIGDIGEMLVILGNFWKHGDELLDQITYIERKIVTENVTYRLKRMADDAENAGE